MSRPDKKKREYPDDDGHVIADMNVEGMPWYRKKQPWDPKDSERAYSKDQRRYIILGTLKAALLIAGAFLLGFLLLILLICGVYWLRK